MTVDELIKKLSKPYWMATDPRHVIKNMSVEHYGQLNLMWVMVGRKPITQGFFDNNLGKWDVAGQISLQIVDGIQVREYATVFNQAEFYRFIDEHPKLFARFLPMGNWAKLFSMRASQ